jgi:hypothetical protein
LPAAHACRQKESTVIAVIAVVALTGGATYTWLTAVMLPVWQGLKTSLQAWWGDGWRGAFPLTIGVAALVTVVPAAAAMLLTMSDPGFVLSVAAGPFLAVGAVSGAVLWCARAALAGAPRLPVDVEITLALSVVALKHPDAATQSRVEQRYHHYMLSGEPRSAEPPSGLAYRANLFELPARLSSPSDTGVPRG